MIECNRVANAQNDLLRDTSSIRDRIDQDAFKRTENIPVWVQDKHTSSTFGTRPSRNLALSWQNSQTKTHKHKQTIELDTVPASTIHSSKPQLVDSCLV